MAFHWLTPVAGSESKPYPSTSDALVSILSASCTRFEKVSRARSYGAFQSTRRPLRALRSQISKRSGVCKASTRSTPAAGVALADLSVDCDTLNNVLANCRDPPLRSVVELAVDDLARRLVTEDVLDAGLAVGRDSALHKVLVLLDGDVRACKEAGRLADGCHH